MAEFTPKTAQQIIPEMASDIISKTPLTDVVNGSVLLTILEAVASQDEEQYFQMLEILRSFSLDTTEGDDLDLRAAEYGVTRLSAEKATGNVTISDSSFNKIETEVSDAFPGPVIGQTYIYGNKTTTFDASGSIIVGRDTTNSEKVNYSSVDNTSPFYTKFLLSTPFTKNHGIDETIIMSQGGNRSISSGSVVRIPSSDTSDEIEFTLTETLTLLDGESEDEVLVQAVVAGSDGNAPANTIREFETLPFPTAEVNNESTFVDGRDEETDQELRDRIKQTIQSLSRGNSQAIELAAIGTEYLTQRVISASLIETTLAGGISKLYIDDGTGFDPTFEGQGLEDVVNAATGGEKFLVLDQFPLKREVYISNLNNKLDFDEGSGELNVTITEGVYELEDLLDEIKIKMEAAGTQVYTVEVNAYDKIEISAPVAFDLLWKTGTYGLDNGLRNIGKTLGFNVSGDDDSVNLYTADYLPRIALFVKNKGALTGSITLTNGSTATSGIAAGEVEVGDYIKITADDADSWARVESVGPVVLSWNYEGTGGTGAAERITLLYPEDYTLNRFNGEFELDVALVSGDKLQVGEDTRRATVESSNAETYNLSASAAFSNPATFTQGSTAVSGTALDTDVEVGDYVKLGADSGGSLTGTLTFTQGSNVVTASGGAFLTELKEGDLIKLDIDSNTKFARVDSVTDNDNLTLAEGYTGSNGAGASSKADPWVLVTDVTATAITLGWKYPGAGGTGASVVSKPSELIVLVNSLNSQTVSFAPFDFTTLGSGTASEVKDRISDDLTGANAVVSPQAGNDKVKIISTLYGSSGKIAVVGGSANTALAFPVSEELGIDGYKYFTGLLQEVQHKIDGYEPDDYEQIKAAGIQIAVLAPTVIAQTFAIEITPVEGLTVTSQISEVKSAISTYVNGLGIGEDVVLSSIIEKIRDINTVFDAQITSPSSNVPIGDDELARVEEENITVS